jgi:hypothetical protein
MNKIMVVFANPGCTYSKTFGHGLFKKTFKKFDYGICIEIVINSIDCN